MNSESERVCLAAYVYPGWHPIAERDRSFHPGFTEWELVADCRPRFDGHAQPKVPALGVYDDRDPAEVDKRMRLARSHGIDAAVYGVFWCRGKRVFEDALDHGFLGASIGAEMPFAVMWANRMPRRVLPVRRPDLPVIDAGRHVDTDVDDFVRFVTMLGESYFTRPNYLRVDGAVYLSIFDSTFFVHELGAGGAAEAVDAARAALRERFDLQLHLAAIDPARDVEPQLMTIGFDSVTHYVHLPVWKGPTHQDYAECAAARAAEWPGFAERSGLPYTPSVATGWDASPRGADFGSARPDKYPWSPVVTGEHPDHFCTALQRAIRSAPALAKGRRLPVFVASLNEWSEGHYLEPDARFGTGWLEAVRRARADDRTGAIGS